MRLALLIVIALFFLPVSAQEAKPLPSIVVLADKSLTTPLTRLARNYSKEGKISINLAFGLSAAQEKAITEGAEANIFITSDSSTIESLKTQGLIDIYSRKRIGRSNLVLFVPKSTAVQNGTLQNFPIASLFADSTTPRVLAIGDPEYLPQGKHAMQALANTYPEPNLAPHIALFKDIPSLLSAVAEQGGAGICYASDIPDNSQVKIVGTFPIDSYPSITYEAVVVAGENMQEARGFLNYLVSPDAQETLRNQGF